jgi:hypothetical protein
VIPALDPITGALPPGDHRATLEEVESRFGFTPRRRWLLKGLRVARLSGGKHHPPNDELEDHHHSRFQSLMTVSAASNRLVASTSFVWVSPSLPNTDTLQRRIRTGYQVSPCVRFRGILLFRGVLWWLCLHESKH